jgi:CelD/BcsL family acetyltransferase involved in cellulose biosynthesis
MRVSVLRPGELSAAQIEAWQRLQEADPDLASPFLRPEFVQLLGAVRDDAFVAVIGHGAAPDAFLPFQRRGRRGLPAGGGLSDCQAIVAAPGFACDAAALLRAMGLARFDFTRMLAGQRVFAPSQRGVVPAPVIELRGGFEGYARERRLAGSQVVTQTLSHARRLERALGPLRFEMHDADPRALHRLVAWKRAQYARARWGGALDPLARPWAAALLERIHGTEGAGFAGVLSTLWAGETMVAAHLGMRSRGVLHYWFPAHDEAQARLAPGRILLLEMIRGAAGAGIGRIELGAGDEGYKQRFANAAVEVAAGTAGGALARWRRRGWDGAARLARHLPVGGGRRGDEWFFRREWEWLHA